MKNMTREAREMLDAAIQRAGRGRRGHNVRLAKVLKNGTELKNAKSTLDRVEELVTLWRIAEAVEASGVAADQLREAAETEMQILRMQCSRVVS